MSTKLQNENIRKKTSCDSNSRYPITPFPVSCPTLKTTFVLRLMRSGGKIFSFFLSIFLKNLCTLIPQKWGSFIFLIYKWFLQIYNLIETWKKHVFIFFRKHHEKKKITCYFDHQNVKFTTMVQANFKENLLVILF